MGDRHQVCGGDIKNNIVNKLRWKGGERHDSAAIAAVFRGSLYVYVKRENKAGLRQRANGEKGWRSISKVAIYERVLNSMFWRSVHSDKRGRVKDLSLIGVTD